MAKRGYRGKHPYNDMKVSKHSAEVHDTGKAANNSKLTDQYNKLGSKLKSQYIRDHEGFLPQATFTLSSSKDLGANSQITMSFGSQTLALSGSTGNGDKCFKVDGTNAQAAAGFMTCVNSQFSTFMTASVTSDVVTVQQVNPGPDSNTEIVISNGTVIPASVTFNGITANNSGSLFFTGG